MFKSLKLKSRRRIRIKVFTLFDVGFKLFLYTYNTVRLRVRLHRNMFVCELRHFLDLVFHYKY